MNDNATWDQVQYRPDETEHEFIRDGEGILFRAKLSADGGEESLLAAETLRFGKWIRGSSSEIAVTTDDAPVLALHSRDFWIPFAVLASDVALQVYLGLVVNYAYDYLKGALAHDKHSIHVAVVYEDKGEGMTKRFEYSGSVRGLQACAEEIDIKKVLEE